MSTSANVISDGIPESYFSLLPITNQNELKKIKQRQVSAASDISEASDAPEFIRNKIKFVDAGIEYVEKLKNGLREALRDGLITQKQHNEAIGFAESKSRPQEKELVVLKRQRKTLTDDVSEQLPIYSKLEDAYAQVIVNRVMGAAAKMKKRKFDQSKFRSVVMEYYNAMNEDDGSAWCHLTGWAPEKEIKAGHIVPKSLQSNEISYLFGVGEEMLSDPRNAITLKSTIELGLDTGTIVLVPMSTGTADVTRWKCIVTDKSVLKKMIKTTTWWKDVDGKELSFLGSNRPARRFLYFRFVITYLHWKSQGTVEWVSEVEAKGTLWATPGPYLRQSMLVNLARKVSDTYLPETFFKDTTFKESEGCAARSSEEEDDMAMALAVRCKDEQEVAAQRKRRYDENGGDTDVDETEDED